MSTVTYKSHLLPYFSAGLTPVITLSKKSKDKVNEFIERLIVAKADEEVHKLDGDRQRKRFYTGFAGEAALEQLFGVEFMDTSVGDSVKYRGSDLKPLGLNVGIKTVRYENDKFPLINKNISLPQVMNVLHEDKVIVFGLATVEVLKLYSDDAMVLDSKARFHKTCFYGYHRLIRFQDLQGLRVLGLTFSPRTPTLVR